MKVNGRIEMKEIKVRGVTSGKVEGEAIILEGPLSFLGGVDPETGKIIDSKHKATGKSITGKIFIFTQGVGSTANPFVMKELVDNKVAPVAIVNKRAEYMLIAGAVLADIPLVDKPEEDIFQIVKSGDYVKVDADREILQIR